MCVCVCIWGGGGVTERKQTSKTLQQTDRQARQEVGIFARGCEKTNEKKKTNTNRNSGSDRETSQTEGQTQAE